MPVTKGERDTFTVMFWPTLNVDGEVERVRVAFAFVTSNGSGVEVTSPYVAAPR